MTCILASDGEKGNAVTLTLLGLSIAILAGVVVLYYVGKSKPEPVQTVGIADEEVFEELAERNPREGWNLYENEEYGFAFEFPNGWLVATGTLVTGDPVVSVYKAEEAGKDTVFSHQDPVSHVSVYPNGIAAEGISGETEASKVLIVVPNASAQDYILETGRPWATKAVFDTYPASWTESGFLFARSEIQEEALTYMRGDTQIAQHEFDPFMGDHIVRAGFIDTKEREVQEEILRSFRFVGGENVRVEGGDSAVLIETPNAGDNVSSPLTVRGTVPGKWYFEDDITAWLETHDGSVITEIVILPSSEWESEDTLPFEVSLVFEQPAATSGLLVIGQRESVEHMLQLRIPILFQ